MDSAQAGLDLWKLAATANDLPAVREAILCAEDFQQFKDGIADGQQADDFFGAYNGFIALHGHHCRSELELANPRWSERPDYILAQLKAYLKNIDRTNPTENYEKLIGQRKAALLECERLLKGPIKRRLLRYLAGKAQSACVLRENSKSTVVRLLAGIRRILLELAGRFHERGILESPDDIFFLRMDDLELLAKGNIRDDLRETIKARRAEHERNLPLDPPCLVFGRFDPSTQAPEPFDADVTTLTGMGTSDGIITGPARVILHADDSEQVNAGEILVAPFTDPGWTPYFIPAAGIVMEQGGHLSHGSVIAREYGLPAVVNVPHAASIIKTGQRIQVDGGEGIVRILE
jgi:pyruvate,water dikinase